MAYDSKRERIVLFGGSAGNVNFNDTWEWDGDNWTQVADNGPSARGGHAMAYDSSRGRVILFGGDDGQNSFGDTWAWDGTDWTQEEDTGPAARTGHAMDYDRVRDRVVVADGAAKSIGPVQVTVSGPRAYVRYAMKGGLKVEQQGQLRRLRGVGCPGGPSDRGHGVPPSSSGSGVARPVGCIDGPACPT